MAHVMSLLFFPKSIGLMLHVDSKKRPCRPVEFKDQGPLADSLLTLGPDALTDESDESF